MQSSDNEIFWPQKYSQESDDFVTWNRTFDHASTDHSMNLASNHLLPYNCTSGGSVHHKNSSGKPIRRRSRASKKTPVTLLNANSSNFRALVQKFTGCHSSPSTCYKGPVTLNFQRGSSCVNSDNHLNSHKERSDQSLVSFGTNYNLNNINAFTSDFDPLFASSAVAVTMYPPSEGGSFTSENFDVENFSGLGDYSTSTWEGSTAARNDESWSYNN